MFTQGKAKRRSRKIAVAILLVCVFLSIFPFQLAKANLDTYWASIRTGAVIGFRSNPVTITTSSNASQVTVKILDPNQVEIYSQVWSGNESRDVTIPAQADYGTYTLKASVADVVTTTWLTVLDVSNWQTASFPYTRQHKGVNYQFFANGTILADNGEDVLNIDLSTLRMLINQLGLDVSATYNSMNFRVRVSKATFIVDLTFSFIHIGCKFTINGTIDQARSFTFKMAEPAKLKSLVDNVRAGSLVFDYGDLRKMAYAFSYDKVNGELTVNIPKTFWIDPVLFEDGFESGDFSAWASYSSSYFFISTTQKHSGTYSAYYNNTDISVGNGNAQKTVSTASALDYLATWFYIEQETVTSNAQIMEVVGPGGWYRFRLFYQSDSTLLLYYANRTGAGAQAWLTQASTETLSAGQWYFIKVLYNCSDFGTTNTANAKVWVNSTEVISVSGFNGTASGPDVIVKIGGTTSGSGVFKVYFDDVTFDENDIAYSGGDSTAPTYSSLSASTTVAGASCQFNATWTDETGLATTGGYIFSTNNTGTWANETWTAFSSNPESVSVSKTLNNTVGTVASYNWYANDTSDNWNSTGIQNVTLTADSYTVSLSKAESTILKGDTVHFTITITRDAGVAVSNFELNITREEIVWKQNYTSTTFTDMELDPQTHTYNVTALYDADASTTVSPTCTPLTVEWQPPAGGGGGGGGGDGSDDGGSLAPSPTPSASPPPSWSPPELTPEEASNVITGVIVALIAVVAAVVIVSHKPNKSAVRGKVKQNSKSKLGTKKQKRESIL